MYMHENDFVVVFTCCIYAYCTCTMCMGLIAHAELEIILLIISNTLSNTICYMYFLVCRLLRPPLYWNHLEMPRQSKMTIPVDLENTWKYILASE